MANTIEAVNNLAPFLGGQLQAIASQPPRYGLDHWDANKDHMFTVVAANFNLEKMQGDNLAACVRKAFDRVWATIPPGRLSGFEDHAKIIGLVYRVASQMNAVRELLTLGKIDSMQTLMQPVVFRDRKSGDLPKPGEHDSALMTMAVGGANIRLKTGEVDKPKYARQLRQTPVMRVGLDDRSTHFKSTEGFYAGTPVDYAAAKTMVSGPVTLGGYTTLINRSAAGVQAFRLEALGWDEMGYTLPVAIIRDMLLKYGDRALEIADPSEVIPTKSA